MNASQSMFNLSSVSSPQYIPSHLSQSTVRTPQQPRPSPPHLKRSSTSSKFGGPSFGTPRPSRSSRSQESSLEDAPPTESIYDYEGGSTFSVAQADLQTTELGPGTPSKQATLASVPTAVIIFGFPTHLTSQVMTHFSRFGTIDEHTSSDAQNISVGHNWIRVTYREPSSARQAVGSNGTSIGGSYMIGCVYAQDEPLASSDHSQDDAMDIDPMTPPRAKHSSPYHPSSQRTPLKTPARNSILANHATNTPGGRKIEILSSDAIYKSNSPITERAASWVPNWLTGSGEETKPVSQVSGTPAAAQSTTTASWYSKLFQGLVDTIFGF